MNKKIKNIVTTLLFSGIMFSVSALCVTRPADAFSESERRELKTFPEFSVEALVSGEFIKEFETYATERFFMRDMFRSIKAIFATDILNQKDNNGLFVADGHISKIDAEENEKMMENAANKFSYLYETYLKDNNTNVYFSIVPDKNYFLAEKNKYPSLDYDKFIEKMKKLTEYMEYIDITGLLSLDDYYTTDTHWRQENITDITELLADKMGADVRAEYVENKLDIPFNGVYSGQLAKPFEADEIKYLTNDTIDNLKVTYYDSGAGKNGEVYNMEKAEGKDPYEIFLSGSTPLATLENPNANGDKELVIFRDSFGGSLAPLFSEGYRKVTVVDIRYIQSTLVGNFVEFRNCDVLFIYSTALLNNSLALR